MKTVLRVIACLVPMSVLAISGYSAETAPAPKPAVNSSARAQSPDVATQRAVLDRYCVGCHNAKLQSEAIAHGHVDQLSPGEIELTAAGQLGQMPIERAWDYWVRQVEKAGLMPAKPKRSAAKTSKKPSSKKQSKAKRRR